MPWSATIAASVAFCAICRMVTLSSSAPSATLRTVVETSSEAAATERACALDSSESDVGLAAGSRVSASHKRPPVAGAYRVAWAVDLGRRFQRLSAAKKVEPTWRLPRRQADARASDRHHQ